MGAACYLPMLLGDARRPDVLDIAVWALLAGLVVFAARDTLRTRSRRFLADAANPTPEERG